jgi:DNA-binding MarR family transcriptional regulator
MATDTKLGESKLTPLLSLSWKLQQSAEDLLQAQCGVGLSHVRIMAALDKSVTRSQSYVAHVLGQTEANVSRQLKAMKKEGLVSITKNKKDKRQRDVSLTPKGYRTFTKADQIVTHHEKGLLSTMSRSDSRDFQDKVSSLLIVL